MAALVENKRRTIRDTNNQRSTLNMNVAASLEVFVGAAIYMDTSGNAVLTPSATTKFMGFAQNYYNNTVASPTTNKPLLVESGHAELITPSGAVEADKGKLVHGTTDDNTFTLTPGAATNPAGHMEELYGTDTVYIRVERLDGLI